jgi:uncharacterized protein (UPF0335 family)
MTGRTRCRAALAESIRSAALAISLHRIPRGKNDAGCQGIAGEQLRSFIERIERLEEERKTLAEDIKEVFAEAKGNGFDTKIIREIIKIRRMDEDDLDEQETLLDIYKRALGMLPDIPESVAAE